MIKLRLGGLFITLEEGEDIPYAPEIFAIISLYPH